MISGSITAQREATVEIEVRGPGGARRIEAVIDTGFNGWLTLPSSIVAQLGLSARGQRQALLADGSPLTLSVYAATVIWHGNPVDVAAIAAEAGPLIGKSMLHECDVRLHVVDGGAVTIDLLP